MRDVNDHKKKMGCGEKISGAMRDSRSLTCYRTIKNAAR